MTTTSGTYIKPVLKQIRTFRDRYPLVGPTFWMLSIQYYLIQITVAASWPTAYSWLHNVISDLGNTACGPYDGRYVCSPLHTLMNASFVLLGVTMILGAILVYQEFRETAGSAAGFACMAIAGLGGILVGFFPENTISGLHLLGALLVFLVGNIGLLVLGKILDIPLPLRVYTLLSGGVALTGLPFLATGIYFGIGAGGMERVVAYPQTMWLIVFGIYISRNHFLRRRVVLPTPH